MVGQRPRQPRARVGAVVAAACAAGLLSGCGSSATPLSKGAYDAKLTAIGRELSNDLNPLASASSAHAADLALTRLQAELQGADSELAAITPPAAIKAEHAKLVAAVGSFAAELGPVIARLGKGDLGALRTVYTLPGLVAIQNASQALQRAGYAING